LIEEKLQQAKALRQEDELEASQEILLDLLKSNPKNPLVLYEVGGSFDVLGEEKKAIPYYKDAIAAGLDGEDYQECLICLGSCYRNLGKIDDAIAVLKRFTKEFPEVNSGQVFLALAYYNDGREDETTRILLDLLLKTTQDENILAYADTLEFYKDHLEDYWDED
jgi:tetratricopeptide (TPR) repeat protein